MSKKEKVLNSLKPKEINKDLGLIRNNFSEYLLKREKDLTEELDNTEDTNIINIKHILRNKQFDGSEHSYTNEELKEMFNLYYKIMILVNKKRTYMPTLNDFAGFLGYSLSTLKNWETSPDAERREIINSIGNTIIDIQLSASQQGEIREITTMFRAKSEHGYVEAQAPITIQHRADVSIDDIKEKIKLIEQGRSLQTIELKKNKNGSYSQEEEV